MQKRMAASYSFSASSFTLVIHTVVIHGRLAREPPRGWGQEQRRDRGQDQTTATASGPAAAAATITVASGSPS